VGMGYYGRVYKSKWRGRTIAVKRISIGRADKHIEREINQLSKLRHENIVTLYGFSMYEDMFHLLEEYADGGSLSTVIHSKIPRYYLANALNWAHQIAQGLAYLHAMKPKAIIHRDIKPSNAILSQQGLSLKICDFGTVVDLTTSMTAEVGTCQYKAPEVFQGRHYDEKCDVHSWAITFWEILARKQPFEKCKTPYAVNLAVTTGDRPLFGDNIVVKPCPEDIINLISACWNPEPNKRYSMKFVGGFMKEALADAGPLARLGYYI
ncbi:hypothetical protein KR200_009044, partial [Drosophila serrata]